MSGLVFVGGSDFSGDGFFSYYFGMFRTWQHSTRCFLSDSIEGQKEGSACYQYVSLHSTVLPRTQSSSSSEYSQGGHLSFSLHWDTRPCRILKVCAFSVVRCTYLQVHRLLRWCRQHTHSISPSEQHARRDVWFLAPIHQQYKDIRVITKLSMCAE